jgi:hypothetical protein
MKDKDIFRIDDEELISRIAKDHPALSEAESERIYAQILSKLGESADTEQFHEAVSGVERYRRPVWHRFVGIAAAVAAFAGIAGSTVFLHRTAPVNTEEPSIPATDEAGRTAAAKVLTDRFLEAASLIDGSLTAEHGEKRIVFINGDGTPGDIVYSPVTDSRFSVPADVTGLLGDIVTEDFMSELRYDGGSYFEENIDTLSGVENGSSAPSFREFCGELYTAVRETPAPEFIDEPVITDSSDTRFTVSRSDGDDLLFTVLWDGGQWRIDDVERK